jgi:hypothetical protein
LKKFLNPTLNNIFNTKIQFIMKKTLLLSLCSFALMLLTFTTQAQESKMDANPVYTPFNENCILDKVEYKADKTIFHFRYKSGYTSVWLYSPEGDHPWFLRDEINGAEYKLIGVYNVRRNNRAMYKQVTGNYVLMNADEKKDVTHFECEVHFERMPAHVTEVDLIEGKGMENAYNHFHCFDIKISPLQDATVVEEVVAVEEVIAPIVPEAITVPVVIEEVVAPIEEVPATEVVVVEETTTEEGTNNGNALEINTATEWSVFPTPATNVLNVKQSDAQEAQLSLVTLSGQVVWTGRMTGTATTINISNVAAGAYFLQHTVNGNMTSQKVLVSK